MADTDRLASLALRVTTKKKFAPIKPLGAKFKPPQKKQPAAPPSSQPTSSLPATVPQEKPSSQQPASLPATVPQPSPVLPPPTQVQSPVKPTLPPPSPQKGTRIFLPDPDTLPPPAPSPAKGNPIRLFSPAEDRCAPQTKGVPIRIPASPEPAKAVKPKTAANVPSKEPVKLKVVKAPAKRSRDDKEDEDVEEEQPKKKIAARKKAPAKKLPRAAPTEKKSRAPRKRPEPLKNVDEEEEEGTEEDIPLKKRQRKSSKKSDGEPKKRAPAKRQKKQQNEDDGEGEEEEDKPKTLLSIIRSRMKETDEDRERWKRLDGPLGLDEEVVEPHPSSSSSSSQQQPPSTSGTGPRITIGADGQIVLDESTLSVSTSSTVPQPIHLDHRHITSATYTKRSKPSKWLTEETDLFYEALGYFGTDFEMIARMCPGRTREMIKSKFKKEEKMDPERVVMCLKMRKKVVKDVLDKVLVKKKDDGEGAKEGDQVEGETSPGGEEKAEPGPSSDEKDADPGPSSSSTHIIPPGSPNEIEVTSDNDESFL